MKKVMLIILSMLMVCVLFGCSGESGKPTQTVKTAKELLEEKNFSLKEEKLELPFEKEIIQVIHSGDLGKFQYRLVDNDHNVYNISNLKFSSTGKNYEVVDLEYEVAGIVGVHLLDSNCYYKATNGGWYWDVLYTNLDIDSLTTSYLCYDNMSDFYCITLKKDNKIYLQHFVATNEPDQAYVTVSLTEESVIYDGKEETVMDLYASSPLHQGEFAPYYLIVKTNNTVYIGATKENPDFVEYADKEPLYWDKYSGFEFIKSSELTKIKDELYIIGLMPWENTVNVVLKDGSWYRGNINDLLN